jgi:ppGpp synthetase/RelA/SpoT-type nucleotidyltranferase
VSSDSELIRLYEPTPLGTNALKRLGDKIGRREPLDPGDVDLYQAFLLDAKNRVNAVQQAVEEIIEQTSKPLPRLASADIAGRDKTLSTLADKLERSPSEKLPAIHDVAGVRIVARMTLLEQGILTSALMGLFDQTIDCSRPPKRIDRLESPSHGYRAMHLVVWPSGRPVEIQVRTTLQHAWAQYMEVLGDRWGREPRYGLPVKGATEAERSYRASVVDSLLAASEAIQSFEQKNARFGVAYIDMDQEIWDEIRIPIDSIKKDEREQRKSMESVEKDLHAAMRAVADVIRRT